MLSNLQGTITALVTPFDENLDIDFQAFKKHIDFQIANGVDAIVVCGSTGESATLNTKEKLSLIIQAVEYSAGRIPIIAGTGSNNTQASIELSLLAKEHGASALLLVAPYYNKPSQEGLYHHYLSIAEQVDIPQIIYNVPGRSGVNITAQTQLKLAESNKNIIATKEASGDLEQMMEIIKYAPEGFNLISGDDALTLPIISIGGKGVISVISNYMPKQFSDLVKSALAGDYAKAKDLQYELIELMALNFIESNPVPAKAALNLMGMMKEIVRLPLTPITGDSKELIKAALIKAKVIKK